MSVRGSIFLGRTSLNLICAARGATTPALGLSLIRPNMLSRPQFSRSFYCVSTQKPNHFSIVLTGQTTCGCGMHSTVDKDLAEFLTEEIQSETKAQKSPKLPKIEGFEIATDGAKVTLNRTHKDEKITVTLNVNHTVDTDMSEAEENASPSKTDISEMKSKPSFQVEVVKGSKTMVFSCNFVDVGGMEEGAPETEAYEDVFNIDELLVFEGTRSESTYAVSGEVMDGYLYDLLMSFLEDRGVSNDFGKDLVKYCTSYEHKLYIGLLDNLKSFVSK